MTELTLLSPPYFTVVSWLSVTFRNILSFLFFWDSSHLWIPVTPWLFGDSRRSGTHRKAPKRAESDGIINIRGAERETVLRGLSLFLPKMGGENAQSCQQTSHIREDKTRLVTPCFSQRTGHRTRLVITVLPHKKRIEGASLSPFYPKNGHRTRLVIPLRP